MERNASVIDIDLCASATQNALKQRCFLVEFLHGKGKPFPCRKLQKTTVLLNLLSGRRPDKCFFRVFCVFRVFP